MARTKIKVECKLSKQPDWPIVIARLQANGVPGTEIERITGISRSTLFKTKEEEIEPPAGWKEAYNLLDLYMRMVPQPLPLHGEYNPVGNEKDE